MMNVNPLIIHKKVLVVGASGMAGQAFMRELMLLNSNPIGLSRNGPNIYLDPTKEEDRLLQFEITGHYRLPAASQSTKQN